MRTATAPSHQSKISFTTSEQNQLSVNASQAYDAWFRAQVHEALSDARPAIPHQQVMDEVQTLIDRKRCAHA